MSVSIALKDLVEFLGCGGGDLMGLTGPLHHCGIRGDGNVIFVSWVVEGKFRVGWWFVW